MRLLPVVFSATGNTASVVRVICEAWGSQEAFFDLSSPQLKPKTFSPDDCVLIACPVYGGRIPTIVQKRLNLLQFNGARVMTVVTYGNRAYEDARLELNDIVTQQGGTVFASAAIVASHSIVSRLAAGRPNALDKQNIAAFVRFAKQKLQRGDDNVVSVPGKRPYRSWSKPPVAPVLIGQCVHCGLCVRQCPVQAIDPRDPSNTDPNVCIMCMRCIRICTQGAKALPAPVQQATEAMLSKYMDVIRENEYFI